MTFLESVPETSKIVIFHEFIHSGKLIAKELERNKYKFERLYGETKDKKGAKDRFLTDKKCKIFLVNNQSGGTSLNLQVANYVFYYESSVSPIVRKQTWKRVHRRGQTKHTFFYDLIAKNSVEQKILDYLEEGKNIFKALVEGKVKL
jgi:SNF2 family DNA or RNA helicase